MVPCLALLSLLGAAALAGVHSTLVENDGHTEEMITRCIVEVLLSSLSKANTPLINPQCKEFLKKSNQPKPEEHNRSQELEPNTRPFSETEPHKQAEGPVREEQDVGEEDFKREVERGPKWHLEGKNHGGSSSQQITSQEATSVLDGAEGEKKNEHEEGTKGGDDVDKRNNHKVEGGKEKKNSEEVEPGHIDKKSLLTVGKGADDYYKHSRGQKSVEEIIQNQETEAQESKEGEEEEEEEEEESNEKYHHSFHEDFDDSLEREDMEKGKEDHKTGLYQKKPRLGKYKNHHNGGKRDSPESLSEEERELWEKRSHYPSCYYERGHHFVEPKNSFEIHRSEEMERKVRGKGHWDRYYPSQDESEEEDMKYQSRGNGEKQYWYVRKRLLGDSPKQVRRDYEGRAPYSRAREGNGGMKESDENLDGRHDLSKVQLEEMPRPQIKEEEDGEPRLSSQEGKHYPGTGEGGFEASLYSDRGKHYGNKRTLLVEEGYPRSHYLVENVKRALSPYLPYQQQLRWKNRHLDKNVGTNDPFLESEERQIHLSEREFVPEYSDYDLWEKQQLLEDLNSKQGNSIRPERLHKPEVKRQYDRKDELARLLSYRKKSAEFPELYSSKEDMKRGHIIASGKGKFSQRPLTHEEEKELENLAAMDLELQKIAEQFNSN